MEGFPATLGSARDHSLNIHDQSWHAMSKLSLDAGAEWAGVDAKKELVDLRSRIRTLEAENAALLVDVNQDEGYERLKVRCGALEAALRDVNMICAQAPPLEDMDDTDKGYGGVLESIQRRVRKAFELETKVDQCTCEWPMAINVNCPHHSTANRKVKP